MKLIDGGHMWNRASNFHQAIYSQNLVFNNSVEILHITCPKWTLFLVVGCRCVGRNSVSTHLSMHLTFLLCIQFLFFILFLISHSLQQKTKWVQKYSWFKMLHGILYMSLGMLLTFSDLFFFLRFNEYVKSTHCDVQKPIPSLQYVMLNAISDPANLQKPYVFLQAK